MRFSLFLVFSLFIASANAITANIYSNSNCVGTPTTSLYYTLNVCKDISQGGFTFSAKPTICNSTWASINTYSNTATCSGSPASTQTGVPGTCINDGSGDYFKVSCESTPISPTISSSSMVSIGYFGVILGLFGLLF